MNLDELEKQIIKNIEQRAKTKLEELNKKFQEQSVDTALYDKNIHLCDKIAEKLHSFSSINEAFKIMQE